jgi:hypothetical protein
MREGFLERFIKNAQYQQSPPLAAPKFLEFCKKRGVLTNERELEFFEKEGPALPSNQDYSPQKDNS